MGTVLPFRPLPRKPPPRPLRTHPVLKTSRREPRFKRFFRFIGFVLFTGLVVSVVLSHRWYDTAQARFADGERVTAIDGDSLRSGKDEFRLLGIDAPELFQMCRNEHGREWACGREAHARLRALINRGEVSCTSDSRDRYDRALATCSAGPIADVGEALVHEGYAVDFDGRFGRYRHAEADARAARRGIWRGSFERPQEWRARHPRTAESN